MTDDELGVEVGPEFDVDVRQTLEDELDTRGIDANISTYEQPMIVATTRREVEPGTYQTFKIEMKADVIARQEELDEIVAEKVDQFFNMAGIEE